MKNSYAITKISIIFLGLLGLMTCMNQSPMSSDNFELVKDVYTDDEAEINVETPTAVPIQDHHNPVFSLTVLK